MSRSPSIGRRLMWLSVISSGAALLAASVALLFFQLQEERRGALRRLQTLSGILAFNSTAAVDFNDAEAATAMLASLKMRADIVSAGLVVNGRLFASYGRRPERDVLLHAGTGHLFTRQNLTVFRPIVKDGRQLGMLFLRSNLSQIDETWPRFAAITGLVAIPAFLIAVLIVRLPQRTIARPILGLASLAVSVSDHKDYSVRAPASRSTYEIEQLVSTFNHMLTEIQHQHAEIQRAQEMLEQRVADRTRELEHRKDQLETQGHELAAANKELESFSYSVSHDLRAPLRAIDGFSQALLSNYRGQILDQRGVHFLERVRAGTEKMSSLIDDMLHLARVTRRTLVRRDVDISALAHEVAAELANRHPDRDVHCVIEPGLRASADAHLLRIVFENLLGNAWKFTTNQVLARIDVGQKGQDDEPIFYVRDNGAGFDMAYADKLFGAFQRLHTEAEFEGTGIGLATVKRILARHGGQVWAEGAVGAGATFYFTLGGNP
jgi:signal transduction histidine kinase